MIGEFQSDLSITCMIDRNFGNKFAGVLFSKSTKTVVKNGEIIKWQCKG